MRISDWSSDVCSSDVTGRRRLGAAGGRDDAHCESEERRLGPRGPAQKERADRQIYLQRFAAGQPAAGPADAKGGLAQCSRPLPAVTMLWLRPLGGLLS